MNRTHPDLRLRATTLAAGELHVWIADLDASGEIGEKSRQQVQLRADECERAARFASLREGERWARSRVVLRLLLGSYLDTDPAELCFELGEHGKPELASAATPAGRGAFGGSKLHFNLSHSSGIGLYAFALDCEVGVDVETPGRDIDVLAVARRALGKEVAEQLRLLDGEHREREFLRLWVRHEAQLKCWGVGIGQAAAAATNRACWTVDFPVGRYATVAVAAERAPARIEYPRWRIGHSAPDSPSAITPAPCVNPRALPETQPIVGRGQRVGLQAAAERVEVLCGQQGRH
jgi:4'-phosphopantetheinyl transferase